MITVFSGRLFYRHREAQSLQLGVMREPLRFRRRTTTTTTITTTIRKRCRTPPLPSPPRLSQPAQLFWSRSASASFSGSAAASSRGRRAAAGADSGRIPAPRPAQAPPGREPQTFFRGAPSEAPAPGPARRGAPLLRHRRRCPRPLAPLRPPRRGEGGGSPSAPTHRHGPAALPANGPRSAASGQRRRGGERQGEFPMAQLGQGRRFPHPFARPLEVPALRPPPLRCLLLPAPHLSAPPAPAAAPAPPPQRCPQPRPAARGRHLWGGLGGPRGGSWLRRSVRLRGARPCERAGRRWRGVAIVWGRGLSAAGAWSGEGVAGGKGSVRSRGSGLGRSRALALALHWALGPGLACVNPA